MPDEYFTTLRLAGLPMALIVMGIVNWKFRNDRRSHKIGWNNALAATCLLVVFGYVAFVPYQRLWAVPLVIGWLFGVVWFTGTLFTPSKDKSYAKDR